MHRRIASRISSSRLLTSSARNARRGSRSPGEEYPSGDRVDRHRHCQDVDRHPIRSPDVVLRKAGPLPFSPSRRTESAVPHSGGTGRMFQGVYRAADTEMPRWHCVLAIDSFRSQIGRPYSVDKTGLPEAGLPRRAPAGEHWRHIGSSIQDQPEAELPRASRARPARKLNGVPRGLIAIASAVEHTR